MKPTSITRAELHALVWQEPRSKLAVAWGISDVAIGKLCLREHIPVPPRGHWAKKSSGDRLKVIPLPMRLPGQRDLVELRMMADYHRWNNPIEVDEVIAPPAYAETIEQVVNSALNQLGPYRFKYDLSAPHRGLRRILLLETNRAEKFKKDGWVFDKPRYLDPRFQRQLKIFNSIFLVLDPILAACDVADQSVWIQGIGHINYLLASVAVGASRIQLKFLEPENPKNCKELPRSNATTLRIEGVQTKVDFADTAEAKIERQLEGIVKSILDLIEMQMRSVDQSIYERKVELKEKRLKEIEDRKHKDEERRLAAPF